MNNKTVVMLALLVIPACAPASEGEWGDVGEILRQSREVLAEREGTIDLEIERRDGKWLLVGYQLSRPGDADVERLARLKTIESLTIHRERQVTGDGLRKLALLPHLKRLVVDWSLTEEDLQILSHAPRLIELNLGTWDHRTALADKGLPHLTNLRRLDVGGRGLSDRSLKYLAQLPNLDSLDLERTADITDAGVAELRSLANLQELNLGWNQKITDAGVRHLRGNQNLQSLSLEQLGAVGIAALKDLPQLEHLEIGDFAPGRESTDLSALVHLKRVSIGGPFPDDEQDIDLRPIRLPAGLRRLDIGWPLGPRLQPDSVKQIEHVQVDVNRFHNELKAASRDLKWLTSLYGVRELTLVDPNEADTMSIMGLAQLRALAIEDSGCVPAIGDEGMRALAGLANLERLSICDRYANDAVPESHLVNTGLDVLPKLKKLRQLELSGLPTVTSEQLKNVWALTGLRTLTLKLNSDRLDRQFDDTLAGIEALTELEELTLAIGGQVKLTDEGLKHLAALKKLRVLNLGGTEGFTDRGLASLIAALPNLQRVSCSFDMSRPVDNDQPTESETDLQAGDTP
ncbi:MAG: hypothetical protein ACOY3P_17080 [Planctomycetota bacterium]